MKGGVGGGGGVKLTHLPHALPLSSFILKGFDEGLLLLCAPFFVINFWMILS